MFLQAVSTAHLGIQHPVDIDAADAKILDGLQRREMETSEGSRGTFHREPSAASPCRAPQPPNPAAGLPTPPTSSTTRCASASPALAASNTSLAVASVPRSDDTPSQANTHTHTPHHLYHTQSAHSWHVAGRFLRPISLTSCI
jgi:hypothetical protein